MTVMLMLPVSTFRLLMLVTATLVSQAVMDECAQVRPSNYVVVRVVFLYEFMFYSHELVNNNNKNGVLNLGAFPALDIDECREVGAHHGHYCQAHTRCVNTIGSYVCECEDGYVRVDELTCVERDECSEGAHQCHQHASCTNTQGGYHCTCNEGFTGNGFDCKRKWHPFLFSCLPF